ncbi:MAG: hypothetical protein Q9219_005538 [cf. Caloplaca sp. 3 TL-2023]
MSESQSDDMSANYILNESLLRYKLIIEFAGGPQYRYGEVVAFHSWETQYDRFRGALSKLNFNDSGTDSLDPRLEEKLEKGTFLLQHALELLVEVGKTESYITDGPGGWTETDRKDYDSDASSSADSSSADEAGTKSAPHELQKKYEFMDCIMDDLCKSAERVRASTPYLRCGT